MSKIISNFAATNGTTVQKRSSHTLWLDYRSEFVFAIVLMAVLALGYRVAGMFIPADLFDRWIWPLLNSALAGISFFAAWLCIKHNDGNRMRIAWAASMLLWGLLETLLLVGVTLFDIEVVRAGDEALTAKAMILGEAFGWVLFIYPSEALQPGKHVWRKNLLLLLPLAVLAVLDYLLPVDLRIIIGLYPIGLLWVFMVQVRKYRRWCEDNFSTMDEIDAQWIIRYVLMLIVAGLFFCWICLSHEPSRAFMQDLYLFFMITYTTERVLYRPDPWKLMRHIPSDEAVTEETPVEIATQEKNDEQSNADYRATLEGWLNEEKPYLNPDFQLTDLRQVLPMNRTYLSQFINAEYGCSFYQWVNGLRIEEAKRMKIEHPEQPTQEIAQHCGFSSTRAFYRSFSRETGMTPREWFTNRDNS